MFNKFGVFIYLDYAHKGNDVCSLIWQIIMDAMLSNGFLFEKRVFSIKTNKSRDEIASYVRKLLDSIRVQQHDLFSFINDCYILDFNNLSDLTLPDSKGIDVEHVNYEELEALGYRFVISD